MMPNTRVHAVGCDHQPGTPRLAFHQNPRDAAIFTERHLLVRTRVSFHTWCRCCCFEERPVEEFAPLPPPGDGDTSRARETSLRRVFAKVVAHTIERRAPDSLPQAEPFENSHT